ncbi:MAG: S8 family serine peptidase, partial [Deltaproteobacteria bacterium]|nr:S8 family serine peptidase [Deltaproteobacteria bacterium]
MLRFLEARGATDIRSLWAVNAVVATVPSDLLPELGALPGVERVEEDRMYRVAATADASPTPTAAEDNLVAIRAPDLWALGIDGAGVVVATLDSGADLGHPDLHDRWRGGANSWFDPVGEHPDGPVDVVTPQHQRVVEAGHGTQVLGLMVGGGASGTKIGVAPGARWIAVRIFDDAGETRLSVIHRGFEWLLDPDGNPETDDTPDVVNLSWGFEDGACRPEFKTDIALLRALGVSVVGAAGNQGSPAGGVSPANYDTVFAVGSARREGGHWQADFASARGPSACAGGELGGAFPDLLAPGVGVRTADLFLGGASASPYVTVTGTSFAAPQAAGAIALLRQAFPRASLDAIETGL